MHPCDGVFRAGKRPRQTARRNLIFPASASRCGLFGKALLLQRRGQLVKTRSIVRGILAAATKTRRRRVGCLVLALAACPVVCHPPGWGDLGLFTEREIRRPYNLVYFFEDSHAPRSHRYLLRNRELGGLPLHEGRVLALGWSERYILADTYSSGRVTGRVHGGKREASWMIVDMDTGEVSGPYTKAEIATDPRVKDIDVMPVLDAWEKLDYWWWQH